MDVDADRWMNGESSAVAHHPDVRHIFIRGRPAFEPGVVFKKHPGMLAVFERRATKGVTYN